MYISKLKAVNYRNFANTTLHFKKGVNTVIGENGSGKTNLFRAIRLLLDDTMVGAAYKINDLDFHRGLDDWRGHWIIISLEFEEIGPDEVIQALFLHGTGVIAGGPINKASYNLIFRPRKEVRQRLAHLTNGDTEGLAAVRQDITISDYETIFTGKSDVDFTSLEAYKAIVGDFENCIFSNETDDPRVGGRLPSILSVAKEVSFTFIQALRDVVSEFHNNRTNPLLALLKSKSGDIDPTTIAPIISQVQDLNSSIEALEDVQTVRTNIRDTLKDAAGETYSPRSLSIKSDLPDEADKLFQSLRLFVGESDEDYEGAIHEMSLGGANLIYLTLKLLEFKYQKAHQSIANFLLIEEPEAHIHTHIQKTLFDRINYDDTQIIYSTHSTNISEVSNIQRVNVLGKTGRTCEAYQPATGLSEDQIGNTQRYLDAIRSNLLFAKSVVLVEGDAEEILVPILFKKVLGVSLDELGVSLINVRSTGFKNVAVLFHETRIRKRCSIITDLDAAFLNTAPVVGDSAETAKFKRKCQRSEESGASRKVDFDQFVANNPWLAVHYAEHTFEVDFIGAGNATTVTSVVNSVYSAARTITDSHNELTSGDKAQYGRRVLKMANYEGKGWFAILLGKYINHQSILPSYIRDAIFFAKPSLTVELFFNIYHYRLQHAREHGSIIPAMVDFACDALNQYRENSTDLITLKQNMRTAFPNDQIHDILATVE